MIGDRRVGYGGGGGGRGRWRPPLLALLLAGLAAASGASAGEDAGARAQGAGTRRVAARAARAEGAAPASPRRGLYYQRNWGVDLIGVKAVSSGYMLRLDYRVIDPAKAVALGDRKVKPYLIDEATRTALAVPAMEKIGELRQVPSSPVPNRVYFMIFGNPGRLVKPGGRVTLVVGNLKAEGLVVDGPARAPSESRGEQLSTITPGVHR